MEGVAGGRGRAGAVGRLGRELEPSGIVAVEIAGAATGGRVGSADGTAAPRFGNGSRDCKIKTSHS